MEGRIQPTGLVFATLCLLMTDSQKKLYHYNETDREVEEVREDLLGSHGWQLKCQRNMSMAGGALPERRGD